MSLFGVLTRGSAALAKANGAGKPEKPIGLNYDPYVDALRGADYTGRVHPGTWAQSYDQLDWWARQPIIQLPPRVQHTTIAEYCKPVQSDWAQGFRVGLKDEKQQMSKAAEGVAREITEVLTRAGGRYQWPPTGDAGGNMESAMGMFLRQSLIYDQAVFEVLFTRGNKPWGWLPLDAAYFRLAQPTAADRSQGQVFPGADKTFVQISHTGAVLRTFGLDELCWFVRNPRVDMRWRGYGYPEYDELNLCIDSLYRTWVYNDANFRNGIHAHTIIILKTAMESGQFDAYRRQFLTMLSQPRNAHRAMVMQMQPQQPGQTEAGAEGVDIKQVGQSNSEMEFSKWLDLQVQILCAGYRMDPIELGLLFGPQGQSSSLSGPSAADRAAMSKGRWLPRLLRQVESAFNASIVSKYHPDFVMRFTGIGAPSMNERLDMDIKAGRHFLTINELRSRYDLPKLDLEVADKVPLDPALINAAMAQASQGDDLAVPDGLEPAPLDEMMKGTNWNDNDEWTQKLATALAPRMVRKDRGAGCTTWVAQW